MPNRNAFLAWCSLKLLGLLYLITGGKAWVYGGTRSSLSRTKTPVVTLSGWSRYAEVSTEPTKVSVYPTFPAAAARRNNEGTNRDADSRTYNLASPREWLESLPNGGYTVLRCDYMHGNNEGGWKIWGLDFHLNRLKDSFKCWMRQTGHGIDQIDYSIPESVTKKILETLLSYAKEEKVVTGEHICEGFTDSFMITILWYTHPDNREQIAVRGHILSFSIRSDPRLFSVDPATVVIALTRNAAEQAELPNRMPCPQAKLSAWCSQRRPLEHIFKEAEVGEVLLVQKEIITGEVKLLEGLTSNLFVLYRDGVIRTAGQDVLLGYARDRLLQSSQRLGIPVDTSIAINILDCGQWQEVFLSSAVKILVPVEKILVLSEELSGSDKPDYKVLWSYKKPSKQDKSLCERLYQDLIENELFG